jgi:uncharacterized protein YdeI (YjbR/CyaY-like superfamily)
MNSMNPKVDEFLDRAEQWKAEMVELRRILLDCGLTEAFKWGLPCYAFQGRNVAIIQPFKAYCAVLFFKGYLLGDADGILVKTGEHTRVGRQVRFWDVREVLGVEGVLKALVYEAIEVERSGVEAPAEGGVGFAMPEEFQARLDGMPALKAAFEGLTLGRQRAYIIYFSKPKQSKTRASRVAHFIPKILDGKGLNDM